jgi:hypothetical protein
MLPPVRARIFLKTSASASLSCRFSHGEFALPAVWLAYFCSPRAHRPVEDLLARRRAALDGRLHPAVDALVEARDGGQDRGLHVGHVLREALDERLRVRDRGAQAEWQELAGDPLEDVRERQPREEYVLLGEVDDLVHRLVVEQDHGVREHRALRVRGGSRGMDHGDQLIAGDRLPALPPQPPLGRVVGGARHHIVEGEGALGELPVRVHGDDVLQRRDLRSDALDLRGLLRVLDDDQLRADVVEDERGLARLRLRVDGCRHGARRQGREVADDPLGPRSADDAGRVAGAEPQVAHAERQLRDPVPRLAVRAAHPTALVPLAFAALRLRRLPADRLAIREALDRAVDQVEQVVRLALRRNVQRLSLGKHRPGRRWLGGRHR